MSGSNEKQKTKNSTENTAKRPTKQKSPTNATKQVKTKASSKASKTSKKKLVSIIAVVAVLIVAVIVGKAIFGKSYEEYDLTGLTIKEACEKARGAGWKVDRVIEIEGSGKTDCYKENVIVTDYYYWDYDKTVTICYGEKQTEEEKKAASSSSSNASSSNTSSNNGASSSNSNWRQVISEYEAWVNDYVDFMKKYNNSSNKSAMLSDYSRLLSEMTEWTQKVEGIQDEMTTSDMNEYLQMLTRINQKLSELY